MRVGIIGAGTIFASHADAHLAAGSQLAAVADPVRERAERAAAQYSIPSVATDWRSLIDRADIDLIDVCTPPKFHREPVIAALQAGKHVLCEKPLATSLAEVDEIIRVRDGSKGKLAVCHQLRFVPAFQRMKWLVEQGHLGRICFARSQRYDAPPPHLVKEGVWGSWDMAGGGVLLTKAIHHLDQLLWLLGDVRRVQALMGTYLFPIESEDHLVANIEFKSGALASLTVSGYPYGFVEETDLVGDRGAVSFPWELRLRDPADSARLHQELDEHFPLPETIRGSPLKQRAVKLARRIGVARPVEPMNYHAGLMKALVPALVDGREPPVGAEDGRKAVELCTALYTSALTGSAVELPLNPSSPYYNGVTKDDYLRKW